MSGFGITMKKWHTQSALLWMQNILQTRFGNFFNLQVNSDDGIVIISLPNDERIITLLLNSQCFVRADSDLPFVIWPVERSNGWTPVIDDNLPAPGAAILPTPLITRNEKGMHVAYDILGLTYWMLSRQEEVGRTDLDEYGRFPAISSHAYKHDYLERPVVDEWLHILGQVMQCTWPRIELKEHNFSMKLSHDVDQPSLYAFKPWGQILRMMGGHLLKRHDVLSFLQAPIVKLASSEQIHTTDPFNTFEWIMDQSENQDLTSAFYFICGHTDPHDADYLPEDRRIRHLMRRIHERGHEIGLHPSYGSFKNPDMIRQEAVRLRRICDEEGIHQNEWGGRMHYLRCEQPTTLQAWSDAGMNYDSTLGYADRPGFRCGTCYEYPAFNPMTQQVLPLRIRPLVLMECSLIDDAYLGLGTGQAALDKALLLKNTCSKVGGLFTLLWHNSNLMTSASQHLFQRLIIK